MRSGEILQVEPTAFRVLLHLLRNPGRLVTKDEIIRAVWSDSVVSDNSLTRSIATLRRLLGDDRREPLYIATVPTIGYRFLCEVAALEDGRSELDMANSDRSLGNDPEIPPAPERKSTFSLNFSTVPWSVGLCVLALAILTVGILIHRAISKREAPDSTDGHLAAEQRLTSNPPEVPIKQAVISPDGKYLAFADPTGLYLRQISNGETHLLPLSKEFTSLPLSWFPDGTHLLALRFEGGLFLPQAKPGIWKISTLGGQPQRLMEMAGWATVSPDGSRIAYLPGPDFGSELSVMDSDGANARRIASPRKSQPPQSNPDSIYPVVWSPDGRRLAYIEEHFPNAPEPAASTFSLITQDANGGNPIEVLKDDDRLRQALWWAPDGRILFGYRSNATSERDDDGVYSVAIDSATGKTTGRPQPVTKGQGHIGGLSTSSDGKRLVLRRDNTTAQAFITQFQPGSHQWSPPRRLTLDANGNVAEAWTADSQSVLFVSNRNGTWKLYKEDVDSATAEVLVEGHSIYLPRLSADGSQALYLSVSRPGDNSSPTSLMSKPLGGGPPRLVLEEIGIVNQQCARAPSKLCIFSKIAGPEMIFVSFDSERGALRELFRISSRFLNWSLSPDGSRLALFLDRHRIRFVSLGSGAATEVVLKDWLLSSGDWSADGKRVFMPSFRPGAKPVILAVSEMGKTEVLIEGQANTEFLWLIQSPDGRSAILGMPTAGDNNAWMVDNF